jgi:two-component system sensor histidine kinase DegS
MPRDSRHDIRAEFARVAEEARECERTDIARELHDTVIQPLSALVTSLAAFDFHPQPPGATEAYVAAWRELTDEAILALRSVLGGLRAHPHAELGLPEALYRYLVPQVRAQGIRLTLESREWAADLPLVCTSSLYLLVREALTNVQKHARATEVTILLRADESNLSIIVTDNGVGFYAGPHEDVVLTTERRSGFGILGMRERVSMLDGELTIVSALGQGTRLEIRVPRPPIKGGEQGRDDFSLLEDTHADNQAATSERMH